MTISKVIKRDGSTVDFDLNKIRNAVMSAITRVHSADFEYFEAVIDDIVEELEEIGSNMTLSVESIQDLVVSVLLNSEHPHIGKHYSQYRTMKEDQRNNLTNIEQSVQRLLDKDVEVLNENANKDSDTFNTQRDLTAGLVAKAKGLKDMLPIKIANAHVKGQIHWHDLDYSPFMPQTNCSVLDMEEVLKSEVTIGNAHIKQAKGIQVAISKLVQTVGAVSSQQFGLAYLPN